jgi:hypothetical protein
MRQWFSEPVRDEVALELETIEMNLVSKHEPSVLDG